MLRGFATLRAKIKISQRREDAKFDWLSLNKIYLANTMISIQKTCCRLGIAGRLTFLRKQQVWFFQ